MNTDTDAVQMPPMPSNVSHVMRRIRRCESETAAQLVLERFAMEYARTAHPATMNDRLAKLLAHCHEMKMTYDRQSRVKSIRATFKVSERTSDYLQAQFALIAEELIENARADSCSGDEA